MNLVTFLLAAVLLVGAVRSQNDTLCSPLNEVFLRQVVIAARDYFHDNPPVGTSGFDFISSEEDYQPHQLFRRVYGYAASTSAFIAATLDFEFALPRERKFDEAIELIAVGESQDARKAFASSIKYELMTDGYVTSDQMVCGESNQTEVNNVINRRFRTVYESAGNSTSFGSFLNLIIGSSLSFVMDTTGSMGGEIEAAKDRVIAIIERTQGTINAPLNYVLAPYNDPGVGPLTKTGDAEEFKAAVNGLTATGGGDFPELMLGGLKLAAEASSYRSIVYVFTDASAKDFELQDTVVALCLIKKISVYIFLTDDIARKKRDLTDRALYDWIVEQTGGVIMVVNKDNIRDATEVMQTTTAQGMVMLKSVNKYSGNNITVRVDGSISNLIVLFTGDFSYRDFTGPVGDTATFENISEIPQMKLFRLNNVVPGEYVFNLDVSAGYSASVRGTSTIGFHAHLQQKIRGTDTYRASRQLRANVETIADFHTYGNTDGVTFEKFLLVSRSGEVLVEKEITPIEGTNQYQYNIPFLLPNEPMLVELHGTNGEHVIQRVDPCAITPTAANSYLDDIADVAVLAGDTITVTTVLRNRDAADTFRIGTSDNRGFVSSTTTSVTVGLNDDSTLTLTVTVPASAVRGSLSKVVVTASPVNGSYFIFTTFVVRVIDDVIRCPTPITPLGGSLSCTPDFVSIGSVCTLSCGDEYRLTDVRPMVCVNGTWSSHAPGICVYVGSRSCYMHNDPHYVTFDNHYFSFMGACLYTLVETNPNVTSVQPFKIQTENFQVRGQPHVSYFKQGFVTIYNTTVHFKQGRVILIDGAKYTLPATLYGSNLQVKLVGELVVLTASSGLRVKYDGLYYFHVTLPGRYMNTVSGLCGNYNDNPSDDFTTSNGTFTSVAEYGNHFEIAGGSEEGCRRGNPDDDGLRCLNEAQKALFAERCAALKGECFNDCGTEEMRETAYDSCLYDLCASGGSDKTFESSLSSYAAECEKRSHPFCNWREEFDLPKVCPAHSTYHFQGNPCHNLCVDRDAASRCLTKQTVGVCTCNEGYYLSGKDCVPVSECGCVLDGRYFMKGEMFVQNECTERCECKDGEIQCTSMECTEGNECRLLPIGTYGCLPKRVDRCAAVGDPHYTTLDGATFDFMGSCAYIMAQAHSLPAGDARNITIVAKNQAAAGGRVSYVKYVLIYVGDFMIKMGPAEVTVTSANSTLSVTEMWSGGPGDAYTLKVVSSTFVFQTIYGVKVSLNGANLEIFMPSFYMHKVSGLCGNYNGSMEVGPGLDGTPYTDFFFPTEECHEDSVPGDLPECSDEDKAKWQGEEYCGKLNGAAFLDCHGRVDPNPYMDNCVFDMCAVGEVNDTLKNALDAYASACKAEDVDMCNWEVDAGVAPECGENMYYQGCASFCQNTCGNKEAEEECTATETFGRCVCEPDYLLFGEKCVKEGDCGCVIEGRFVDRNAFYYTEDCAIRHRCVIGTFVIEDPDPCVADNVKCVKIGDTYNCVPRELPSMTVAGDPLYKTFDNFYYRFDGDCAYLLAGFSGDVDDMRVPRFRIIGVNGRRKEMKNAVYLKEIVIELMGHDSDEVLHHIRLLGSKKIVRIDGAGMTSESAASSRFKLVRAIDRVSLEFEFGVNVRFDGDGWARMEVDQKFEGKLHGLGGNFDSNPDNDLMIDDMAVLAPRLGDHWIVTKFSDAKCMRVTETPEEHPCDKSGLRERYARECECGVITDTSGPFAVCHELLDPAPFFEACLYGMCSADGNPKALSRILSAYYDACVAKDGTPGNWVDVVKIPLTCPKNSHYDACPSPCPAVCGMPVESCNSSCEMKPTCVCDSGYLFDNGECVAENKCGCENMDTGLYVMHGECVYGKNCSEKCTCVNGMFSCEEASCYEDQYCGIREAEFGCHWLNDCEYENGGCSHACNFDGNTTSCSCPPGSILNEDGKTCMEIPLSFYDASTGKCGAAAEVWKREMMMWKTSIKDWQDEVEIYKKAVRDKFLPSDISTCNASWTEWFDRDNGGGCGDEETVEFIKREYKGKVCDKPLAAEARMADGSELGSVIAIFELSADGLLCKNADQEPGVTCPDFAVRFLCESGHSP